DILPAVLPAAWRDGLGRALDFVGTLISAGMTYYGAVVVLDAYDMNTLQFKNLVIQEWILFLPLMIGCAMLTIEFLLRLFKLHTNPEGGELAEFITGQESV